MADFPRPFAGNQTLERPQPVVTIAIQFGTALTLLFNRAILYGDGSDLSAWTLDVNPAFNVITAVAVNAGAIAITLATVTAVGGVTFTGPQPIFRVAGGAVLEPFSTPVPFP